MTKKIFRIVTIASLATLMLAGFAGCKKKTECDICGEKASCSKEEIAGEEIYICDDCKEDMNDLVNAIK